LPSNDQGAELAAGEPVECASRAHGALRIGDAEAAGHGEGRRRVVARHHQHPHAGLLRGAHGVGHLRTRRIPEGDQAEEAEVRLAFICRMRQREHAEAFARPFR